MITEDLNQHVLLIDDDEALVAALTQAFQLEDILCTPFTDPLRALEEVDTNFEGVIVTDVRMPKLDGFQIYKKVREIDKDVPVIYVTGHADVPMVLGALKDGAYDFFTKPLDVEHLLNSTRRALEARQLQLQNRTLRKLADQAATNGEFLGDSPAIAKLRDAIRQIAESDVDVLIEGETGTGKELVARLLHRASERRAGSFTHINCAALPSEVAEGQLFGYASGGNLHDHRERRGKLEAAQGGTLFLDKVESLSAQLQGQLLPVVDTRLLTPIGAETGKPLDIRIVASSLIDLAKAVDAQNFRADLYYKFNTIRLRIPPLRERRTDIPLLFSHFLREAADELNKKVPALKPAVRRRLTDYDWPGNVRELKNFARSVTLGIDSVAEQNNGAHASLPQRMEAFEADLIRAALEQGAGDVRTAVELLGIPRKTFYDKASRHQIDLKSFREKGPPRS